MPCTAQFDYPLIVYLRNARPHCVGKLCLCKDKIELNRTFVATLYRICEAADICGKLGEDAVNLVLLLVFQELDLIVSLDNRHRLDENGRSARRGVMDKSGNLGAVFVPYGDNITSVSHCNNIILKIF